MEEILEFMGMSIVDGMIVEQNSNYYYQSEFFLLPEMTEDEFTAGVKDEYYAFTPYAKGIVIEDEENEDFIYNVFMKSSSDAFSKMDMSNTEDLSMKDEDAAGPFNVGVEARKALSLAETDSDGEDSTQTLEMQEATLVVVGTDYFITDEANSMVGGSNQLIFNNMIGTFSDYEVSVSVPVKDYTVSYLMASAADIVIIGGIIAVVLPVSSLIIGFVIWYKRRKR